jgi:hypothetical protein
MNKRKLVISLILGTVALSVISLSASLAWYASSDRLQVNSIDLDLRTDESVGLYIGTSTNEEAFKEKLSNEDLNKVKQFAPTSSMFHNHWLDAKKDMPEFYNLTEHDIYGVPDFNKPSSEGFYQQKLYLLNNIDYYVTLDTEQTFITSDKTSNHLRAQALVGKVGELTVDEIEEKLNKLENSMRFSILVNTPNFYQYYIIDPNKDENKVTYYAGRLDVNADEYYDTFNDREILYGEVENRDAIVYDNPEDPTFVKPFKETPNEFFGNAFNGKNDKSAYTYNEQNSLQAGVKYKQEPSISLDDINSNDNPLLIPCYNGVPTEIVLSIYLEGWDLDCYNSTMGASFDAQLSFKVLRGII